MVFLPSLSDLSKSSPISDSELLLLKPIRTRTTQSDEPFHELSYTWPFCSLMVIFQYACFIRLN